MDIVAGLILKVNGERVELGLREQIIGGGFYGGGRHKPKVMDDIKVGGTVQAFPDICIVAGAGEGGTIPKGEEGIDKLLRTQRLD